MRKAAVSIRPDAVVGDTDPRLFGAFVEHVGRCVYGGLYEPGHPTADGHGFRADVLALVRELGPTVVRYPGGNTRDAPQRVAPSTSREVTPAADRVRLTLRPASWNVTRVARASTASGAG